MMEMFCTNCDSKKMVHKNKKVKVRNDRRTQHKVYRRVENHHQLISPLVRNVQLNKRGLFMNYTLNVQLLLSAFYIGHSGDTLGFRGFWTVECLIIWNFPDGVNFMQSYIYIYIYIYITKLRREFYQVPGAFELTGASKTQQTPCRSHWRLEKAAAGLLRSHWDL